MKDFQPPSHPIDLIVFDCDGTLSALEGIDFLAGLKGHGQQVTELTNAAMTHGFMGADIFKQRLELVQPSISDMHQLATAYFEHRTPSIIEVCGLLQRLGKTIWVASAGMQPSIGLFSERLGIPATHSYALELNYDQHGNYLNLPGNQPFCQLAGKTTLLKAARKHFNTIAMIGDGANDVSCISSCDRFIGFGGHHPRESIKKSCQHYVLTSNSLCLLPLLLTEQEAGALDKEAQQLFQQGLVLAQQQEHLFYQPDWQSPLTST